MKKGNPPIHYFDLDRICPFCDQPLVDLDDTKFEDGTRPYIRHRNKFHWCHVSCYIFVYNCMKETLAKYPNDVMINNL